MSPSPVPPCFMKYLPKSGAVCAAFALSLTAAPAIDVLHVANADSDDYRALIEAKFGSPDNWTHVASSLTNPGTVGGDLDRITDFPVAGTHGGTGISVRSYLESFDLVIIGNGVTSGNFVDGLNGADWAALTRPVLFHASLVARALGGRPGMFSGDNNVNFTYGNPDDTVVISNTPLGAAIFNGVTFPTDLYNGTLTEAVNAIATYGGGELISSVTDGIANHHGIVFWNAGLTNGAGLTLASKRGFMALRNAANSSTTLTGDGKLVLGNLIDQLLIPGPTVFLPPSGVTANGQIGVVNLTWTPSAGATSYNVKRSTTPGGGYVTISTPGSVTGGTYADTTVVNDTPYYYVVSAVGAAESANSPEVGATPVSFMQPTVDILYVSNANSGLYQTFTTTSQFGNNTFTQKATGLAGNDAIGGDLDRLADFSGLHGGFGISVKSYMESFGLIIVSIPTTSGNLVDAANGADWSALSKPVLFHAAVTARALDGRPGVFSGDNFFTLTLGVPEESIRVSNSALSNTLFAGTTSQTDLFTFLQADVLSGLSSPGTGQIISRFNDGLTNPYGLVFWAAGDYTGTGQVLAANRAYLPLKGDLNDLNADGRKVMGNLINQLLLPQTATPPYAAWVLTNLSSGDPAAPAGFNDDADQDGILNGLEWILGGNPLNGDPGITLPLFTVDDTTGLTLSFNRAVTSTGTTTLSLEWSADPSAFPNSLVIGTTDIDPDGDHPTVDIDAPAPGQVTVHLPAAHAVNGRLMARLRAALKP